MSDPWVEAGFFWTDHPHWAAHGFSVRAAVELRALGFGAHHAAILRAVLNAEAERVAIEALRKVPLREKDGK